MIFAALPVGGPTYWINMGGTALVENQQKVLEIHKMRVNKVKCK